MDIQQLTQQNILDPNEVLASKFNAISNAGIGVKQFTCHYSDLTADAYAAESMRIVAEVVKEVELQNLTINEVGIQILEDTIHNVFKLVVAQNRHNLLLGGTISKTVANTSGLKVYDYLLTFNFMANDEESENNTFSPDRLQTVAVITVPLNLLGGLDMFGDNVTFDILFKPN